MTTKQQAEEVLKAFNKWLTPEGRAWKQSEFEIWIDQYLSTLPTPSSVLPESSAGINKDETRDVLYNYKHWFTDVLGRDTPFAVDMSNGRITEYLSHLHDTPTPSSATVNGELIRELSALKDVLRRHGYITIVEEALITDCIHALSNGSEDRNAQSDWKVLYDYKTWYMKKYLRSAPFGIDMDDREIFDFAKSFYPEQPLTPPPVANDAGGKECPRYNNIEQEIINAPVELRKVYEDEIGYCYYNRKDQTASWNYVSWLEIKLQKLLTDLNPKSK